jgi:hypothetical protein
MTGKNFDIAIYNKIKPILLDIRKYKKGKIKIENI